MKNEKIKIIFIKKLLKMWIKICEKLLIRYLEEGSVRQNIVSTYQFCPEASPEYKNFQLSDLQYYMIDNRIFDVKQSYYGYILAAYWALQLSMEETFILNVEQTTKAKEFIIDHLVLHLNYLDAVWEDLRSKNFFAFSRST